MTFVRFKIENVHFNYIAIGYEVTYKPLCRSTIEPYKIKQNTCQSSD